MKAKKNAARRKSATWGDMFSRSPRTAVRGLETAKASHPETKAEALPPAEMMSRELQALLDVEIMKLPEKYRAPFVLCCLEGKSKPEVSSELGWKEGTVSSRLARARQILARQLRQRGVEFSVVLGSLALSQTGSSAAIPHAFSAATIQAALSYAHGGEIVSPIVARLVKELSGGMKMSLLKTTMAIVVAAGLVTGGASAMVYLHAGPDQRKAATPATDQPVEPLVMGKVTGQVVLVTADQSDSAWGTIKGQIVYEGDSIPEPKPLNITKDQEYCLSKGPILSEDWVVNKKNKGVRWTFVWLAPEPGGTSLAIHPALKAIPNKEVEIDQPRCAFVPHCLAMREGQVLVVKNSSTIAYNVHWNGTPLKNREGNMIILAGGTIKIEGLKEDKFPLLVGCNIHTWMKARVGVFAHPYFAVTDENGHFEIKLAPAGEHRLKVYHESVGWRGGATGSDGEKITVKGGGITDLGNLGLKPSD
jgi:hypothetical protein